MTCPYDKLANKLEVHQKVSASPGFPLSELEVQTIIEALRYTADWKAAIEAADTQAAVDAGWTRCEDMWCRPVRPDEPRVKNRVEWVVATAAEALQIDARPQS